MEQVETVQENSQSCWHLIEKKELQSELDQLVAKRDKLEEKKNDIGEIIYDFDMFILEGQVAYANPESLKIARSVIVEKDPIYCQLKDEIQLLEDEIWQVSDSLEILANIGKKENCLCSKM